MLKIKADKRNLTAEEKIILNVVQKYATNFFQKEKEHLPYQWIQSEQTVEAVFTLSSHPEIASVRLKGVIDGLYAKAQELVAIDYKTGQSKEFEFNKQIENALYLNAAVEKRNKEALQMRFYQYLLLTSDRFNQPSLAAGRLVYLRDMMHKKNATGIKSTLNIHVNPEQKELFVDKMTEIFNELFDLNTAFDQTPFVSHCQLCDYAGICRRN